MVAGCNGAAANNPSGRSMKMALNLIAVLWCGAALCAGRTPAVETPAETPNVLFIAVDDLNDWVNCLGGRTGVHTPNIDRLAGRGVLFTNAHCAAPSCNPSRVAVMTGVRPSTSGIYHNGQNWRSSPRLARAVTIPDCFRKGGYKATGGGKIFHALSWISDRYGKQQNDPAIWDGYFPSKTKPMPEALWPTAAAVRHHDDGYVSWKAIAKGKDLNGRPPHFFDFAAIDGSERKMADHQVVDWAIEQLGKKQDQPFFQAVGIFRPHIPWFVPKKYFDLYPIDEVALPKVLEGDLEDCSKVGIRSIRRSWHRWLLANDQWRAAVQGYLASISFADAQVGRLLDALDRSPHADNTIVVLWSDHGMHIGEKEQWEKFTLWEESTRVPLVLVVPGVTKPGGRCRQPVGLVDLFPTLTELCGLATGDAELDGVSFSPQLRDPDRPREQPAVTTWGRGNHAVRTADWRYIRFNNGDEELYDHTTDPDEFTNLAARQPDKWRAKMDKLARWLPKIDAPPHKQSR